MACTLIGSLRCHPLTILGNIRMADLNEIITKVTEIDTNIKIKALARKQINELADLIIWDTPYAENKPIRFGSNSFKPTTSTGLLFDADSVFFNYELKTIAIVATHIGTIEGGKPYKWSTVAPRIRKLKILSKFIYRRGFTSFSELNELSELRLRNLISDFLLLPVKQGGLNSNVSTSICKIAREALLFLSTYQIVYSCHFDEVVNTLTVAKSQKHETENRLKHPIIPIRILKALISDIEFYIDYIESNLAEFLDLAERVNESIRTSKSQKDPTSKPKARKEFTSLKQHIENIQHLNLYTATLVLTFTGMRYSEVDALKNGCNTYKDENGEDVYSIRSTLRKTSDGEMQLDWIANKLACKAIKILSQINKVYLQRAETLLEHNYHTPTSHKAERLRKSIKEDRLFGFAHNEFNANPIFRTSLSETHGSVSLKALSYHVSPNDVSQLEKMDCNYQSTSANSGKRGVKYRGGELFNFTPHQFRHTFAWFIIANQLGDLDDIKYQFKHLKRAMTMVYSERGFKSLDELKSVVKSFERYLTSQVIEDIVTSAQKGTVSGGGGTRLSRFISRLNESTPGIIYSTEQQGHFNNVQELVEFAMKYSDGIRGLPHGYCTKGPECKIKNAADPSHCLYCDTYFATPKHLPYWVAIKNSCRAKIERIQCLPDPSRYESFLTALKDNLASAEKVIVDLTSGQEVVHRSNET